MFRIAFTFFIIYLIYLLWKRASRKISDYKKSNFDKNSPGRDLVPGEMVSCAKCQTFILKSDAIEKQDKFYCSKQCLS